MTSRDFKTLWMQEKAARGRLKTCLNAKTVELHFATLDLETRASNIGVDPSSAQQQAEQRLWDAIEIISDGFALFDARGKLIRANSAYGKFLARLPADTGTGATYDALLETLADSGLVVFDAGDRDGWLHKMRDWHRRDDRSAITIHLKGDYWLSATERRTRAGDTASLVADITDQRHRARDLAEAGKQAGAENHAKSSFLASMSHEIRTPMNGIVGMADLLCDTRLDAEQTLFANTIKSSGEALLVILNDVLDYSRIAAGKLDLYPTRFDLEQSILDVALLLQPRVREKNIDLVIDYDMFLPATFVADEGRIRQILTNLLGNAVKFTDHGFILVRIVGIEGRDGTCEVHIAVEDSGIGIAADKLEMIFDDFNQINATSPPRVEGTGLGLAISERLVAMMGGEIWADSTPGKGSCFGFRLSLPTGLDAAPKPAPKPSPPPDVKHALVVDDLAVNRAILGRQLGAMGLKVTTAASGHEALAILARPDFGGIDVIITDHRMQGMDGVALLRILRGLGVNLPALLLSSNIAVSNSLLGDGLFSACLHKPILRDDLGNHLRHLAHPGQVSKAQTDRPEGAAAKPANKSIARSYRVLVAEDNQTNQLVLGAIVQGLGLVLDFAENGRIAVEKFTAGQYDMVFMDIEMPQMNGIEATRLIRAFEAAEGRKPLPIIALTAHAMAGDRERFEKAGLNFHLAKPLTQ